MAAVHHHTAVFARKGIEPCAYRQISFPVVLGIIFLTML
jgi:hypothetical protein